MPLFEFRIKLRNRSVHNGVRQLDSHDINFVYRTYLKKAEQHYRNDLASFDVVMISKLSDAGRAFIQAQGRPQADFLRDWQPEELKAQYSSTASRKKAKFEGKSLEERNS